jgi:lysyl-tRNA synthetase class 2
VRAYFERDGFLETACGAIAASPGNETHLHAVEARVNDLGGTTHSVYLHTSPEFAMKKLLAAGEPKLFELARVFRGREAGPLNATEFTMLEWYRANEPYAHVIGDTIALIRVAAAAAGVDTLRHRGHTASLAGAPLRLTMAEAFERYASIDLLASIPLSGPPNRDAFARAAQRGGVNVMNDDSWNDIFSRVVAERIEPALKDGIVILDEYPRPQAALARLSPRDPRVAERFEVFVCGVELANGFGELTDASEQRARLAASMDEKQRIYGERYPIDEDFIAAIAAMPPASGVAMGFDRLVMLATDAHSIEDVLWTPPFASQPHQRP